MIGSDPSRWREFAPGDMALEENGFVVEACFGWFDRTPFRGGEDMIFVARAL